VSAIVENCANCAAKGREVAIRPRHAEYQAGGGWRYWYRCPECGHRWGITRLDETACDHVPHWLYRIYGTGNELLYIGITSKLPVRLSRHARDAHWSLEIRDIRAEWYPDLPSADAAETAAIRAEKPLWNEAKTRDRILGRAPAETDPERAA
jgi:predicted GIY-YIG superfamily endonuclease